MNFFVFLSGSSFQFVLNPWIKPTFCLESYELLQYNIIVLETGYTI